MDMNNFKEQLSNVVPIILKARMKNGFANSEKWQQMQVLDEAGDDINQGSFSAVDIAVYSNFLKRYNDQYRGKILIVTRFDFKNSQCFIHFPVNWKSSLKPSFLLPCVRQKVFSFSRYKNTYNNISFLLACYS